MTAPDPFKQAWQSAPVPPVPDLDTLRRSATRFDRRIRRRNLVEYAAAALVALLFGAFAILMPVPVPAMRVGAVLIVLAAGLVAWQLHRRASARPIAPGMSLIEHHRGEMMRQRDALASVGRWYLAPFLPGLLLVLFGPILDAGPAAFSQLGWRQVPVLLGPPAFFLFVWWLNHRAARRLQVMIDDLDLLENER